MSFRAAAEPVAFHPSGEALTLGCPCYGYFIPWLKLANGKDLANLIGGTVRHPEFPEVTEGRQAFQVALKRRAWFFYTAKAYLNSRIAIPFQGFHLDNGAWAYLHASHTQQETFVIKQLGHANLST
jgi:hypothetical protein